MNESFIVGLYGISGCGKSHTLNELGQRHPEWLCLEGSKVIEDVLQDDNEDSTIDTFKRMSEEEKTKVRERAIVHIQSLAEGRVAIIAGHFSFPHVNADTGGLSFVNAFSQGDGQTYDAILYLKKDVSQVHEQRTRDSITGKRTRTSLSQKELEDWMKHEEVQLEQVCEANGISFHVLPPEVDGEAMETLIYDKCILPMVQKAETDSHRALISAVQDIPEADTFLLLDGDRTLWDGDTGKLFFGTVSSQQKAIFQRRKAYQFVSFWESAMLFTHHLDYEEKCKKLSDELRLYNGWIDLLGNLPPSVLPILVTSGVREIWAGALEKVNISMPIVAGNHLGRHSYIVDKDAKAIVARELRKVHPGCHILAFGDSDIDIPMMEASDRSCIVLDNRNNHSMKEWIRQASTSQDVYQLSPCADYIIFHHGIRTATFEGLARELERGFNQTIDCSCQVSMQILCSQSRRKDFEGPVLQDIHRQSGARLSERLLDKFGINMGLLTKTSLPHVQGSSFEAIAPTSQGIMILPLMRAGEPLSRGVYESFPGAKMVHYIDGYTDLQPVLEEEGIETIIVVDSVINRGNSMRQVLQVILQARKLPQVFVLSSVTQSQAAVDLPNEFPRVRFLTLRISQNQYTGRGGTDTGNRLFGTL